MNRHIIPSYHSSLYLPKRLNHLHFIIWGTLENLNLLRVCPNGVCIFQMKDKLISLNVTLFFFNYLFRYPAVDATWWNISQESTYSPVRRFMFIDTTCPSFQDTKSLLLSLLPFSSLVSDTHVSPGSCWGSPCPLLSLQTAHSWPFKPRKPVLAGHPICLCTLQVWGPAVGGQVLIQ